MRFDFKPERRALAIGSVMLVVALGAAAPAVAEPPDISSGPSVSGAPLVGEVLRAEAEWEGNPFWRWFRCDSLDEADCARIPDVTTREYTVTPADLGKRLRVRLLVRHRGIEEMRTSSPTAVVTAGPAPAATPEPAPGPGPEPESEPTVAPTTEPSIPFDLAPLVPAGAVLPGSAGSPTMMRPHPVVRIRGRLSRIGARITLLTVLAPRGARISIRCRGRSCPASRWARTTALTRIARFQINLRAGTRLIITVTKPGRIGKHTAILIRDGRPPWRRDRCIEPGATGPTKCPAT